MLLFLVETLPLLLELEALLALEPIQHLQLAAALQLLAQFLQAAVDMAVDTVVIPELAVVLEVEELIPQVPEDLALVDKDLLVALVAVVEAEEVVELVRLVQVEQAVLLVALAPLL